MRIQKYPDTCVGDLDERLDGLPPSEPFLSGIQANDQAPQRAYPPQVINAKCTNDTYVKTLPKRMAVAIFRDTMQRTVFTKTTKVLCLVSCVLC